MSSVRLCHNTRNFCEFCNAFVPVAATAVSPARSPYPYPELLWLLWRLAQYPGYGYTFLTIPGEPGIHSGLTRRVHHALWRHVSSVTQCTYRTPNMIYMDTYNDSTCSVFLSFLLIVCFLYKVPTSEGHFWIKTIHVLWIELHLIRFRGNIRICIRSGNHVLIRSNLKKIMKNVRCEHDRLNGWNSTLLFGPYSYCYEVYIDDRKRRDSSWTSTGGHRGNSRAHGYRP